MILKANLKKQSLKKYFFFLEVILFWAIFFYLGYIQIFHYQILLLLSFSFSIFFSLYYGTKASGLMAIFFFLFYLSLFDWSWQGFLREDINLFIFLISEVIILIIGIVSQGFQLKLQKLLNLTQILKKREEELLSDLISVDLSYNKFLKEHFFNIRDPNYPYQEFRISIIKEDFGVGLFVKIFKILNRYAFVEIGSIFQIKEKKGKILAEKIFNYGMSQLPKEIKDINQKDWFLIIKEKREILLSHFPSQHGFFLSIPIFLGDDSPLPFLLIMIEQIRFTMLNEQTYINLKVISLILKKIIVEKISLIDYLKKESICDFALIYNWQKAKKLIPERKKFWEELNIEFSFLLIDLKGLNQKEREKYYKILEETLRIFDEKFLVNENQILVILVFTTLITPIKKRMVLKGIEEKRITKIEKNDVDKLLFGNN